MKVGFTTTSHWSDELRPTGGMFIKRFHTTLKEYCRFDYQLYIIDNASTYKIDVPPEASYTRIDDQRIGGITAAWNRSIYQAYADGCDIIINCNEDLYFNDTINVFIQYIHHDDNDDIIYSALSNGILGGSQKANAPSTGIQTKSCTSDHTCVNGFFFGMTRKHYEKYRFTEDQYFNKNNRHNGGDGKWGGQEGQFIENSERGLSAKIINECWLPHDKQRGWKQLVGQ
jgi:hypothetical protein